MTAANPSHALAVTLVDELARCGVGHACIAPGSRSAPLALALHAEPRIATHVILDERSAAFAAVGIAKASRRPCVVLSTSGTAAANLHAAVLEAYHSNTPLIVLTADRPPELRATGAPQTVDQIKLFGDAVRWFVEVGTPEPLPGSPTYWRSLAARAYIVAMGPAAGPVHLNVALREPLTPEGGGFPHDLAGRHDGAPWSVERAGASLPHPADVELLARRIAGTERGLVVAGACDVDPEPVLRFAAGAGWPVLAEPASNLRAGELAVSTYDALLRSEPFRAAHRPSLVVRFGALGISKQLVSFLAPDVAQIAIDAAGTLLDPERAALETVRADPASLCGALAARLGRRPRSAWTSSWLEHERRVRSVLDGVLDAETAPSEPRAARDAAAAIPAGGTLVVAASMPVRDLDWFMAPRSGLRVVANRGANGIDGFVSTTLGVARASAPPVVALCGDLSLLHDQNGLLRAGRGDAQATFVVLDNDGGGVFSFLPQAAYRDGFETLFGTPQGVDLGALARLHGCGYTRIARAAELPDALERALEAGGVNLVEVPTDRDANVKLHERIWRAAVDEVGEPAAEAKPAAE